MINKNEIELLAPAGSYEGFEAVLGAGADAVYVGGAAFGARAYAKNFQEEELLRAIDVAHIHGKKLYLTVNTLLKNKELEESLYDYVLPYYRAGLDAVLVQDLGVMRYLRRKFPDLPLHASTQMTVTGAEGMKLLEKEGLTRIVGARELSLKELKWMHENSSLEIEAFVHGALCYSYSGQCLMSSIFGGRSGNRGRCAQPCRLSYQTAREDHAYQNKKEFCPLSLKDMCTVDELPGLLEAGVVSLKIEGRMKQPEYAAGVTSIYRKYLDRLFAHGAENYAVEEKDRRFLVELFSRGGSCKGYLMQHNGPDMMAFSNEKKTGASEMQLKKCKEKIIGTLVLYTDLPSSLTVTYKDISITVSGENVQRAENRPMDEERIRKQLEKLGNTEFVWEDLQILMDDSVFVPMGSLNELRRDAVKELEIEILRKYRRSSEQPIEDRKESTFSQKDKKNSSIMVSCETEAHLQAAMDFSEIKGVYLPFDLMKIAMKRKNSDKDLYLAFPHMVRGSIPDTYIEQAEIWLQQGMKGFLIRNLESFAFAVRKGWEKYCVIDASLYTWNDEAISYFEDYDVLRDTVPYELNEKEIQHRNNRNSEMIIYGYLPLMTSAQCVRKNVYGCDRKEQYAFLKDRYGAEFKSRCYCYPWKMDTTGKKEYCYNIIYNSLPYGLLKDEKQILSMNFETLRLSFTIENEKETRKVLRAYIDVYCHDKKAVDLEGTRGHFRRGAE